MEDTFFICNSEVIIYPNATNANRYLWSTRENTENITVSSVGKYWVTASNQRCQASDTTFVVEKNIPDFEIQTSGDLCKEGSADLFIDIDIDINIDIDRISYRWSPGGELSDRISIHQNGVYGVAVSFMGCTTLQNIDIKCPCNLFIPNVFTQNRDSINDKFIPQLEEGAVLNSFSMFIYDMWGALVFQTNTYSPWYGVQNENYVMGNYVYTYIIYYSCMSSPDIIRKEQGRITVIR
jgi:hypothetical protein